MTEQDDRVNALANYHSEKARGIVHTPEWDALMADEQRWFDEEYMQLPQDFPESFGQQYIGWDDPHPWMLPLAAALAMLAFGVMLMMGRAPWQ